MEKKCEFNSHDLVLTVQGIFCSKCQVRQRYSRNYPIMKVLNRLQRFHEPFLGDFWSKDFLGPKASDLILYEHRIKHPKIEEIKEKRKKKVKRQKNQI